MLHFDAPTGTHGFYISFLFQTLFVFCYCSPLFLVIDTYSICLYIFVTKHTKNMYNSSFTKKFFLQSWFSLLYFWSFNIFAVVQSLNCYVKKRFMLENFQWFFLSVWKNISRTSAFWPLICLGGFANEWEVGIFDWLLYTCVNCAFTSSSKRNGEPDRQHGRRTVRQGCR